MANEKSRKRLNSTALFRQETVEGMITPSAVKSKEEVIMTPKERTFKTRQAYAEFIKTFPMVAENLDGDKFNNHVSNLEWATSSENIKHTIWKIATE